MTQTKPSKFKTIGINTDRNYIRNVTGLVSFIIYYLTFANELNRNVIQINTKSMIGQRILRLAGIVLEQINRLGLIFFN